MINLNETRRNNLLVFHIDELRAIIFILKIVDGWRFFAKTNVCLLPNGTCQLTAAIYKDCVCLKSVFLHVPR